jgi:hypothetical protein
MLAKRDCRRDQRLISWRVMINEHAEKLRVKHGYYTDFRLVGVSARSRGSRYELLRALPVGVRGSGHQT